MKQHPSASVQVCQRLRGDIMSGHLPFGSRLKIDYLAARYGSSHMPIRQALRHLEGEGLVVLAPNRGARVRSLTVDFISSVFDMRISIEAMLARRAAQRIGEESLARIAATQAALEAAVAAGDVGRVQGLNRDFHAGIDAAACNPDAVSAANRHWDIVLAMSHLYGYPTDRLPGVVSDHRHIVQALTLRDPEAASVLIVAHAIKAKQDLIRLIGAGTPR